jgi:hypothetical protein
MFNNVRTHSTVQIPCRRKPSSAQLADGSALFLEAIEASYGIFKREKLMYFRSDLAFYGSANHWLSDKRLSDKGNWKAGK